MSELWQHIQYRAQTTPDEIVIISHEKRYSWQQLQLAIDELAKELQQSGTSRLALLLDNSFEWIVVDVACQLTGIVFVPLPGFFSDNQLLHVIEAAGVNRLITSSKDKRLSTLLSLSVDDEIKLKLQGLHLLNNPNSKFVELPEGTTKITFTSGTTGQPKGVCLNNEQQIQVAKSLLVTTGLTAIRHLSILPYSTLLENIAGIYATLLSGGFIIAASADNLGFAGSSNVDFSQLLSVISFTQPQSFIVLPELLHGLNKAISEGWSPPTSLKFIAVGGSRVSPALLSESERLGLPVYEGYGLSECASVVSLNSFINKKLSSVGKVLPHLKVVIEDGEIVIMGNSFLGYVHDKKSWYPDKVFSGDLGYYDEQGYLFVDGRKKNIIITSFGRNINPEWVECELMASGLFKQAIIFGDAKPFCVALVVPMSTNVSETLISEYISHINSRLPSYSNVRHWKMLETEFNIDNGLMTSSGKPKREAIFQNFQHDIESFYQRELV